MMGSTRFCGVTEAYTLFIKAHEADISMTGVR